MDDDDDDNNGDEPTLLSDILGDRDDLSTLFGAVEASGQLNLTEDENADITVFAPNNNAFADINTEAALADENSELLEEIVQYHVLNSSVLSGDIETGTVSTAFGEDVLITERDGNLFVNEAQVVEADIEADNGVLHVVDGLLLENRSLLERISLTASTQALAGTAADAGLVDGFEDAENWTVFTPINEAFEEVDTGDLTEEELADVLQYHVIVGEDGPIDSETLLGLLADNDGEVEVETAQGEPITFTETDDGAIALNGDQATLVTEGGLDRFAGGINDSEDGYVNVFHLIDGVLTPPSMQEPEAISIAEAREQGVDAEVTIEGTVTRAFGDFVRIQDDSGDLGASGIVIRQPEGSFNEEIADETITEGTTLRVTGTISEFNGLLQINEDDLASYEVTGEASVPDPLTITLTDLAESGLDYESVLVRIDGLTLNTEDAEFSNGASYTATDGDGNEATFRVQQEGETQLGGEPVPSGTFDYEGVIGQFQGEPQMIPVEVSDIIQE